MSSLTRVAITTRKIIRYGIFFIVALIIGRVLIGAGVKIYKKIFPPPLPAPTVKFGKLPKLPFPAKTNPSGLSFTLETAEGGFPKFTTQAKVFFMPKPSANLLSLSTAKIKAEGLGFDPNGQQVSQTIYHFPHKVSPSTLEMDIVSGTFSISYDFKVDSSPLNISPPFPEVAASQVRSYLSSENLLPADLTGPTTNEFLKLEEEKFVTALSKSEANLIKIKLSRKSYDNLPVYGPDQNDSNIWFMVSGIQDREKQIVVGQFHYFPVDESQFSTYPIKTAEESWKEFTEGKGFVSNIGANKEGDNIKIRKMYLAYYDAGVPTDFLQPIIVLEGDKGFSAYIPAVTSNYYGD